MAVSIDLADPVTTLVDLLNNNFSAVAVEVVSGFERGGYSGTKPDIIPVEGEIRAGKFYARQGQTNLQAIAAKAEIYVYNVSREQEYSDMSHDFADKRNRITIDIYHVESRARMWELVNEITRILYKVKKVPTGNWTELDILNATELTNRNTGIWRYVIDVQFLKVSDYVGHA